MCLALLCLISGSHFLYRTSMTQSPKSFGLACPMWHCRNCGWLVSSMGEAAQEHPQEAAREAQGLSPTELQISSTENITSSCRIENISGGQLTPSPLHVSLSRWEVENRGWTFLPSVPPCYLLVFLSWCVDVTLAVMFSMCCTRSWIGGT